MRTNVLIIFSFVLASFGAHAQIAMPGAPFGVGSQSRGGGLSPAVLDATYLRLDTTNDPLTGPLTVANGSNAAPGVNLVANPTGGLWRATAGDNIMGDGFPAVVLDGGADDYVVMASGFTGFTGSVEARGDVIADSGPSPSATSSILSTLGAIRLKQATGGTTTMIRLEDGTLTEEWSMLIGPTSETMRFGRDMSINAIGTATRVTFDSTDTVLDVNESTNTVGVGVAASAASKLAVAGAMVAGGSDTNGVNIAMTTSGTTSANAQLKGLKVTLGAGAATAFGTFGLQFNNLVAGTGTNEVGTVASPGDSANFGFQGGAVAVTAGHNIGGWGNAHNSSARNIGLIGTAMFTNSGGGQNIGAIAIGRNTGGGVELGAFIGLTNGIPTLTTAGLIVDNGDQTAPIQIWRDNGTIKATFEDGGNLTLTQDLDVQGGDITNTTGELRLTSTTSNVVLTPATGENLTGTGENIFFTAADSVTVAGAHIELDSDNDVTIVGATFSSTTGGATTMSGSTYAASFDGNIAIDSVNGGSIEMSTGDGNDILLNPSGGAWSFDANTLHNVTLIDLQTDNDLTIEAGDDVVVQAEDDIQFFPTDLFEVTAGNGVNINSPATTIGGSTSVHLSSPSTQVTVSDLDVTTAGKGLRIKEGSNARLGASTLVGGTVVVSNTSVTANTRILITAQNAGGTVGFYRVSARTAGTSFTITSSNVLDTSSVAWMLVEPSP